MSGNIGTYTRGHVAIATPELLAEIERFLELGLIALPEPENLDDDEENGKKIEIAIDHLCRARTMFRRELKKQLDREHRYMLGGPDMRPVLGSLSSAANSVAEPA